MPPEHHFKWEWDFKSPPEAMWPYVADTNRFNADTGIPGVRRVAGAPADGASPRLEMNLGGMRLEWDEAPFEWTAPRRFGVVRTYRAGPMSRIKVDAEILPRDGGGSHLVYQIWMTPRGLLAKFALPLMMKWKSRPAFDAVFRRYDGMAQTAKPPVPQAERPALAPGAEARLAGVRKTLLAGGLNEGLVDWLLHLVRTADDLTLMRLRPYELADRYNAARWEILDLCLHAVKAGLLDFRWDMMCPSCRGAKATADSLAGLSQNVHCDTCNIDYEVDFDRSVELTFRPNPAIRAIDRQEFCVGGPGVTPHIVAQQVLAPGETRALDIALAPGAYRVRTRTERGGRHVRVADGGAPAFDFAAAPEGWPADEAAIAPHCSLRFLNRLDKPCIFILERTAWSDLAVTAAEVTSSWLFRDLFSREALRPGQEFSVGSLCVLFTDILESTRLYREIGDARAFGLVMQHFDVLKKCVAAENGGLVKTIGDAVLAVFRRPVMAIRALLAASKELATPPKGTLPLMLKAGIHVGPCIAVTLNERLDYFGSTVNIAARLVGLCAGGDLVMSSEVRKDPEVEAILQEAGHEIEDVRAELKGFAQMRFELARVITPWTVKAVEGPKTRKTQRF
jgi:class 3 adenylate cyclase